MSAVRLREVFIEGEAFGFRSLLPGPLSFSRQLFVTYVDEELLVLRDEARHSTACPDRATRASE